MIIDDDSGEETIYQTEKEGGRPTIPRSPHPRDAPPLGQGKKCEQNTGNSNAGCVGRVKAQVHERDHLSYRPDDDWIVRIFDETGEGEALDEGEYPGDAVLHVVGKGMGRKLRWPNRERHPPA